MKAKNILIPNIIICIVVSIIAFLVPTNIPITTFLVTYVLYLLFQIFSWLLCIKTTEKDIKKRVNNTPIWMIYVLFHILFIILLFCSRCLKISFPLIIILCVILLGMYSLLIFLLYKTKNYIIQKDSQIKTTTQTTKSWKIRLEIIISKNKNDSLAKELNELYETLKYIDTTSNESTIQIDEKINNILNHKKETLTLEEIQQLDQLWKERSIILKNTK